MLAVLAAAEAEAEAAEARAAAAEAAAKAEADAARGTTKVGGALAARWQATSAGGAAEAEVRQLQAQLLQATQGRKVATPNPSPNSNP